MTSANVDDEGAVATVAAIRNAVDSGVVTIDADRGHFNPEILEEVKQEIFNPANYRVPLPGTNERLLASLGRPSGSWALGQQIDSWVPLYFSLGDEQCYKCGESMHWEFNGKVIRLVAHKYPGGLQVISDDSPCAFSGDLQPIVTKIPVPSGQILIGNDLRHIFDEELIWSEDKDKKYTRENSINHYAGKVRYMERYAKQGMLTGYLGSGGVNVYHHSTGILVAPYRERHKSLEKDGRKYCFVGHISLGLWWYGAADYERCLALNKKQTLKTLQKSKKKFHLDDHALASLEVKPGTYEIIHQLHIDDETEFLSQIQLVE